jgi:hypothetical protein
MGAFRIGGTDDVLTGQARDETGAGQANFRRTIANVVSDPARSLHGKGVIASERIQLGVAKHRRSPGLPSRFVDDPLERGFWRQLRRRGAFTGARIFREKLVRRRIHVENGFEHWAGAEGR